MEDHHRRRDPAISGDGEATSSSEKCRLVDVYGAQHLLRLLALLPAVLEHEREGAPGLPGLATLGATETWTTSTPSEFEAQLRRLLDYLNTDDVFEALFSRDGHR